jgi:SAM-dependent methyltransferase
LAPAPTRVALEQVRKCPLCAGSRGKLWRQGRDRLHLTSDQQFSYARCLDCGLIFQNGRPREEDVSAFYPSDYGPYKPLDKAKASSRASLLRRCMSAVNGACAGVHQALDKALTRRFWRDYWRFYQPSSKGDVLLDFGCGSEKFLNRARALGWRTIGADFCPQTVERVRSAGHQAFTADDALWNAVPDGSLDCVRLNHVLEHLYSPRETLTALRRKLKPGARIHLAVPNPRSITSWLFRSCWLGLDCPRHIMLFTPARLTSLLRETGYRDVRLAQETASKDMARSIAYVLADLGWIDPRRAGEFLHAHALQCLLYAPMRLATALRLGDRLHAFASV